ncbi:hypothetical protein FRC12_008419 [Ceratobasidium sp. 428]|nr:hypothetical protein FRC12_008419 [Ceratobasidium sp. 428]
MADFFVITSVVDKAAAAANMKPVEQNAQMVSETVGQMNETKESGKGSNFSMCEIIM